MDSKLVCENFVKFYFDDYPDLEVDASFMDAIVEKDQVLYKFFVEGKTKKQMSEELNVNINALRTHIIGKKKQINTLFEIYSMTGCKKDLIDEVSKVRFKMKYKDDIISLYNRGVKKPLKYIRFTEHYFPEVLGKLGKISSKYLNFIDEVLERKKILEEYFGKGRMAKDISLEMGKSEVYVTNELYELKNKIRSWYCSYSKRILNKNVVRSS